jgi:hypothetical protein
MNLQEHIRKVIREDRKASSYLRRRIDMLDYEIESRLDNEYTPTNICRFKSGDELFETIMEDSIDSMYFNYFYNIDDNSGEWAHEYLDMVLYLRDKYEDKIKGYYRVNCVD